MFKLKAQHAEHLRFTYVFLHRSQNPRGQKPQKLRLVCSKLLQCCDIHSALCVVSDKRRECAAEHKDRVQLAKGVLIIDTLSPCGVHVGTVVRWTVCRPSPSLASSLPP